jgi:hypothetical protein
MIIGQVSKSNKPSTANRKRSKPQSKHFLKTNKRTRFLLFFQILRKTLHESDEKELWDEVKTLVRECVTRHRMGSSTQPCLVRAIRARLRHKVGDVYWRQAQLYTWVYFAGLPMTPTRDVE